MGSVRHAGQRRCSKLCRVFTCERRGQLLPALNIWRVDGSIPPLATNFFNDSLSSANAPTMESIELRRSTGAPFRLGGWDTGSLSMPVEKFEFDA